MNPVFRYSLLSLLFAVAIMSCKEETLPGDPISPVPSIELRNVSPGTVTAFSDSLVFELYYIDGDGDLGFEEADSAVVYLTDTRFPLTEQFHVQPLSPPGTEIIISGIWQVVLPYTILEDEFASSEQAVFSIQIRDRAGNFSNTVLSEPVTVIAP